MNKNNIKLKTAKVLAKVSLKLGKMSSESACIYIYHQPNMPKALKKLKSK